MFKVLLVDDDYITREGLRDLVDWAEMDMLIVGEADNGRDAWTKALALKPDIVLSDVVMPVLDGIGLVSELRRDLPETRVIMISAHQDIQYIKAAMKLDAIDYILKPFNLEELRQVLEKVKHKILQEREEQQLVINASMISTYEELNQRGRSSKQEKLADRDKQSWLPVTDFHILEQKILDAMQAGTENEVETAVRNFFLAIQTNRHNSPLLMMTICADILHKTIRQLATNMESASDDIVLDSFAGLRQIVDHPEIEPYLIRKLLFLKRLSLESLQNRYGRMVNEIKNIIRGHYSENLTISKIAEEVFMSVGHLQALFKKQTGMTINSFLTNVRIERSKELLRHSPAKIYEIASLVGYQDADYFANVFRRQTGQSPAEYREKSS